MKRIVFLTFILLAYKIAIAQPPLKDTTKMTIDTTKKAVLAKKFYNTLYVRMMPLCIYTGAGYPKDRINQNFEIGKTFGMIDAGLALGRNALRHDTANNGTTYLEAKFTMDIAQYGIFSNEMTVGAGGVFNAQDYLMLELSYTIYAQFWKNFGVGIITGFYDFSGDKTDNSRSMFGLFCRYGIMHSEGGIFNAIGRMNRPHNMHNNRRR